MIAKKDHFSASASEEKTEICRKSCSNAGRDDTASVLAALERRWSIPLFRRGAGAPRDGYRCHHSYD